VAAACSHWEPGWEVNDHRGPWQQPARSSMDDGSAVCWRAACATADADAAARGLAQVPLVRGPVLPAPSSRASRGSARRSAWGS